MAPEGKAGEFWFFHEKTGTIRSVSNSDLTLSYEDDSGLSAGTIMVARPYSSASDKIVYDKSLDAFKFNSGNLCIGIKGKKNAETTPAVVATCAKADESQHWYPFY